MNYIKVGGKFINLEAVMYFKEEKGEFEVNYIVWSAEGYPYYTWIVGEERTALIAWLNVPNHMAGIIDPVDRDVMAWWERQQERADYNKTVAQFKPGTLYRDKHDGVIYTAIHTFQLDGDTNVFGQVVGGGDNDREWIPIDDCEIVTDATETEA
jgi:hypothetical protein